MKIWNEKRTVNIANRNLAYLLPWNEEPQVNLYTCALCYTIRRMRAICPQPKLDWTYTSINARGAQFQRSRANRIKSADLLRGIIRKQNVYMYRNIYSCRDQSNLHWFQNIHGVWHLGESASKELSQEHYQCTCSFGLENAVARLNPNWTTVFMMSDKTSTMLQLFHRLYLCIQLDACNKA